MLIFSISPTASHLFCFLRVTSLCSSCIIMYVDMAALKCIVRTNDVGFTRNYTFQEEDQFPCKSSLLMQFTCIGIGIACITMYCQHSSSRSKRFNRKTTHE